MLGLPLAEERHGTAPPHWGCELGDVHFAIHPRTDAVAPGPIKLAFWVFDVRAVVDRLGVDLLYPVRSLGPTSLVTAILDPDGNEIELTQMGADWVAHLEQHRRDGADVLTRAARPLS